MKTEPIGSQCVHQSMHTKVANKFHNGPFSTKFFLHSHRPEGLATATTAPRSVLKNSLLIPPAAASYQPTIPTLLTHHNHLILNALVESQSNRNRVPIYGP